MEPQINYAQLCQALLKDLPGRSKDVLQRRFGLNQKERDTLEKIGEEFGITRERVRQIQEKAIQQIKETKKDLLKKPFANLVSAFKKSGGIKREDTALEELGGSNYQNQVFFLLNLCSEFNRHSETKDLHPFWSIDDNAVITTNNEIASFVNYLTEKKQLVTLADYKPKTLQPNVFKSTINLSRSVAKNADGLYGLIDWPEVNPKNIKDKAYLILKKETKPLHFSYIYSSITNGPAQENKKVLLQSVHNELIRNPEFVLIGRGIYALKEWGYKPGWVKDILVQTLQNSTKPLPKEELISQVMDQRQVKKSTILLNLSDKKFFAKDKEGNYTLKC